MSKDIFPKHRLLVTFKGSEFKAFFGHDNNCFGGKNDIFFSSIIYSSYQCFLEVPRNLGSIESFRNIIPTSGKKVSARGAGGPFFYPDELHGFFVSDLSEAIMNIRSEHSDEWKRFMNRIVVITVGPPKNIVGFWFEDDVIHEISGAVLSYKFNDLQHVFESFPQRRVMAAIQKRWGNHKGKR